jgi:hypothetical protein
MCEKGTMGSIANCIGENYCMVGQDMDITILFFEANFIRMVNLLGSLLVV